MPDWLTVGTVMQVEKRDNPNVWVSLKLNGETLSLTALQAREVAILLQDAARQAEKQREGQLVVVPDPANALGGKS